MCVWYACIASKSLDLLAALRFGIDARAQEILLLFDFWFFDKFYETPLWISSWAPTRQIFRSITFHHPHLIRIPAQSLLLSPLSPSPWLYSNIYCSILYDSIRSDTICEANVLLCACMYIYIYATLHPNSMFIGGKPLQMCSIRHRPKITL